MISLKKLIYWSWFVLEPHGELVVATDLDMYQTVIEYFFDVGFYGVERRVDYRGSIPVVKIRGIKYVSSEL